MPPAEAGSGQARAEPKRPDVSLLEWPELGRLLVPEVLEKGEAVEWVAEEDATADEADDFILAPALDAFACFKPRDLKRAKADSAVEDRELVVDMEPLPERVLLLSASSLSLSFLALCSPTSSRSGSVQKIPHMASGGR